MRNEKNKTKKEKFAKNKRAEKEIVDTIQFVHKKKGQRDLFHLRAKVRGKWVSCGAFYPEVGWRSWSIFPRGECERSVLQLQYQFRGESIHFRAESWREESPRVIQTQATLYQNVRRGLPIKNRTLYKIK